MSDSPSEIDAQGYRDMIRIGVERGLIKSEVPWFGYRELRNITNHVYDTAKAKKVFGALRRFLRDAKELRAHLDNAAK
jgi:nucleotidyltransferase substrate binding protein (TIGR01987 family)